MSNSKNNSEMRALSEHSNLASSLEKTAVTATDSFALLSVFNSQFLTDLRGCLTLQEVLGLVTDYFTKSGLEEEFSLFLVDKNHQVKPLEKIADGLGKTFSKLNLTNVNQLINPEKINQALIKEIRQTSGLKKSFFVLPFVSNKSLKAFGLLTGTRSAKQKKELQSVLPLLCNLINSHLLHIFLYQKVNRYKSLVRSAKGAIFLLDQNGIILECNPSASKLLKIKKASLLGTRLSEILDPSAGRRNKAEQEFRKCLATGNPTSFAFTFSNAEGKQVNTSVALSKVNQDENSLLQVIIRDQTSEIAQQSTAYRARLIDNSNIHLRNILNELDFCTVSLNTAGKVIYVDDNFCHLTGYAPEDVLQSDFFSFFYSPEGEAEARQQFLECVKSQELKEAKRWDLRQKSGDQCSLQFHFVYDYDALGRLSGISCIGRDTTEQNHTIDALHDNRMQMQDLIDNAFDLIQTVDTDYRFLFTNRAWQKRLGYTLDDLAKLTLLDIVHPDYRASLKKQMEALYSGRSHLELETLFLTKRGEAIYLRGSITCQYHNNKPVASRAILHDETQRIKANQIQSVYYRIANLAISTNDLQSLYKGIHEELSKIIETTNIYLALCNDEGTEIHFPYYVDHNAEKSLVNYRRPFQNGLTEYIIQTRKPLLATKEEILELATKHLVHPFGHLPKVFMGCPLVISDRIIGVVALQSSKSATAYTNQDLDVLHFISNQIALAIERKRNEEQIKNHKARLEAIFESSSHIMWSVDRNLNLISYNRNYAFELSKFFGLMPEQRAGLNHTMKFFWTDENYQLWMEKYRLAFEGKPQHFIVEFNKDGENFWREIHLNPVFLEKGNFDEVSGISQDITEKRKKEIALAESEEKFRRIFESILDVYYRTDMQGYIQHMSPSVYETFGFTPEEVVGMHGSSFYLFPDDRNLLINTVLEKGKVRNFETAMVRKDGSVVQAMLNSRLILGSDGKPVGLEGVAKDITELKETQAALIKAKEQAENLLKVKSQFLANMSHELRTPMNGIIGMIELLGQTNMSVEQKDYIETLRKSTEALLIILNDILDLSKIQAGKLDLKLTSIDLELCIEKIFSLFQNRAFQKGINFYCLIQPDVPKFIKTDEIRLLQILSNLVSNAIKFTNAGEVKVIVSMAEGFQEKILFEVFDSGIGIKKESQHLLFNNFSQVDNSSSKTFAGTGLGLAISLQLTKMLGGDIGVESEYGSGSKFWFTIRYESPDKRKINADTKQSANDAALQPLNWRPKILLVDDNQINLKVGTIMLEKLGCQINKAENGYQAIELVLANHYDLIFMDIQMPEMDGVEATRRIKREVGPSCPPVIAMTAYSMKNDADKFINQGMDGYISKPVKQKDFLAAINHWKNKPGDIIVEPRSGNNASATIDADIVQQLKDMGGNEFALQLYSDFENEAEKLVAQMLKSSVKGKDSIILANLHQLKGTAGTLGIKQLAEKARLLEEEIKSGKLEFPQLELEVLNNLFTEYKTAYRDLFN